MSPEVFLLFFILIGLVTGLLAGMLGIGSGVVAVPCLYYLFQYSDLPQDRLMQIAASTSLACTFVTSFAASLSHQRKKSVLMKPIKFLLPGLILGCAAGSYIGEILPSKDVRMIFGCLMVLLGIYFFFPRLPHLRIAEKVNKTLMPFGFLIGVLSSLLGIGGGTFSVPILIGYHLTIPQATGTSSVATLLSAFIGSVSYLIIGLYSGQHIPHTFGFIQLPAFLAISLASVCTTSFGVHLAHRLPVSLIKRILGCVMLFTGINMLLR